MPLTKESDYSIYIKNDTDFSDRAMEVYYYEHLLSFENCYYDTDNFELLSSDEDTLPKYEESSTAKNNRISGKTKSNGYVLWGQYISLDSGTYEVTFSLHTDSKSNELGNIDIFANEVVYDKRDLSQNMFDDNGNADITLKFSTAGVERLEARLYLYENIDMELMEISYKKVSPQYEAFADTPTIIDNISTVVNINDNSMPIYFMTKKLDDTIIKSQMLANSLTGHSIIQKQQDNFDTQEMCYIIAPTQETSFVLSLLPQYTILAKMGNYTLLVSNNATEIITIYEQSGNVVLSSGNSVNALYFASEITNAQNYTIQLPSGIYNVNLYIKYSNSINREYGNFICSSNDKSFNVNIDDKNTSQGVYLDNFQLEVYDNSPNVSFALGSTYMVRVERYDVYIQYMSPVEENTY